MKTLIGIALALAAGAFLLAGCGKEQPKQQGNAGGASASAGTQEIAQKTCPVMEGNKINPKLYVDYKGRRIYLCCKTCVRMFKENPEKYVRKVDEQLAGQKAAGSAGMKHENHDH